MGWDGTERFTSGHYSTSSDLSTGKEGKVPMADFPRGGRRGKESTSPVKQQVGFEPGTFGPQSNHLATSHSQGRSYH